VREHRLAIAVIVVANLLWAFATPVGEVHGSRYAWALERQDVGLGKPTLVRGEVVYSARGFGVPDGPFRLGSNTWKAEALDPVELAPTGGLLFRPLPTPLTPALVSRVGAEFPNSQGREGFFVDGGALAKNTALAAFLSSLTFVWWIGMKSWKWNDDHARFANIARLLSNAVWPFLLGASIALFSWERLLHRPRPPFPTLLDPEAALMATVALASVGLVVVLTRREWSRH
jgi:hypothetical protein